MSAHKHWDFSNVDLILAALKSTVASNPQLALIESEKVIFDKNAILDPRRKVVVISGGGAGHEPLHAGFVGDNLLSAAVAGNMFASPSTKQILSAIVTIADLTKSHGLPAKQFLIVVKNYTGDVLHFGLALERAKSLGHVAEMVIVEDDVSVGKANGGLVGRRALAGTALAHKVAGGLAAQGEDLKTVVAAVEKFIGSLVTIGASLDHCSLPGRKLTKEEEEEEEKTNKLPLDQCEIGMGIHNETGVKRIKIPHISKLVEELLQYLLSQDDADRSYVKFNDSDKSVLLINNLGGTSNVELFAIAEIVLEQLSSIYKIIPVRTYIGNFVTSINGNGFSITLTNLDVAGDEENFILDQLDKPSNCIGWNSGIQWPSKTQAIPSTLKHPTTDVLSTTTAVKSHLKISSSITSNILKSAITRVRQLEPKVTNYDIIAGDGDCGETLLAGANAISKALDDPTSTLATHLDDPVAVIFELANLLEDSMGGTSGGLYSIFMSSLAKSLKQESQSQSSLTIATFAAALSGALESLFKYTRARAGDKTLIDTLQPFVEALSNTSDLQEARNVAIRSAKATKKLDAKFGRASYVSKDELKKSYATGGAKSGAAEDLEAEDDEEGVPDPGAIGLAAIIDGGVKGFF